VCISGIIVGLCLCSRFVCAAAVVNSNLLHTYPKRNCRDSFFHSHSQSPCMHASTRVGTRTHTHTHTHTSYIHIAHIHRYITHPRRFEDFLLLSATSHLLSLFSHSRAHIHSPLPLLAPAQEKVLKCRPRHKLF
jgi:hypothetical protein